MNVTHLPEDGTNFIPYEVMGKIISFNDSELMFDASKRRETTRWLLTSARTTLAAW